MSDDSIIGSRKWRALRWRIFQRDHFSCTRCGWTDDSGATLHCDHVVPRKLGGDDDPANLTTLCARCNQRKGDRLTMPRNGTRPAPRSSAPRTRPLRAESMCRGDHDYVDEEHGVSCARCGGRWSRRW